MHHRILLASVITLLSAAGCSFVKPDPGAEAVRLLEENQIAECESRGSVKVSVLDRVIGLDRHQEDVENNLETLARNHAAEVGADTIVPLGPVENGERRYGVYRCSDADTSPRTQTDSSSDDDEEEEGVTVRGYERD